MKDNPTEKNLIRDMQPGRLTMEGFLGQDKRQLEEIIKADQETLQRFGQDAQGLAKIMSDLTQAGMLALGDPVQVDGFRVQINEWMGWLGCPFKDAKRAAKRLTIVQRIDTEETMTWSDLHLHLIAAHGFFQGQGSSYRLEPEALIRFLNLA